jgi:hypothetical protein
MDMAVTQITHRAHRRPADSAVPVLFIACSGRSGSTLLDRVIGLHDGFRSAGELRFIWERSFGDNQLCGCGVPFDDCVFWDEVSHVAFGMNASEVDATAAVCLRESLDKARYAPWLVQSRSPACYQAGLLVYRRLLAHLYEKILQVSRDKVIVDSSGDGAHGLILSRAPGIELHVVHLVRDPRAVAFSWMRTRRRPEIHWSSEGMPIERAKTSAIRWMLNNTMAERLAQSAASYCRVRYEDFVASPSMVVSRILKPYTWINDHRNGMLTGSDVVLAPSHTVSGNPMRFRSGQLKIKLDDEWRVAMCRRDRLVVEAITWPLLTRYGYRARSGA